MPDRRFPAPWRIVRIPSNPASPQAGYAVEDASGVRLAYIYGDDRERGAADRGLTMDEARRIAAGVAKLPGLVANRQTDDDNA